MEKPVYQIIENDIKKQIKSKELKSGQIIPSENKLREKYNVSRMTVRQALNNLVTEGYLYKHKGKGTFVSQRKIEKNIFGLRGFTEEMQAIGRKVKSKVVNFKKVIPDDEIAQKLFLEANQEAFYIERIRFGDETPVLFEVLYVPCDLFKELTINDLNKSFYKYIEDNTAHRISHCFQIIEAKLSNKEIEKALELDNSSPILNIIRNSFLDNGRPFEYVISSYRADQYKFVQHAVKN